MGNELKMCANAERGSAVSWSGTTKICGENSEHLKWKEFMGAVVGDERFKFAEQIQNIFQCSRIELELKKNGFIVQE